MLSRAGHHRRRSMRRTAGRSDRDWRQGDARCADLVGPCRKQRLKSGVLGVAELKPSHWRSRWRQAHPKAVLTQRPVVLQGAPVEDRVELSLQGLGEWIVEIVDDRASLVGVGVEGIDTPRAESREQSLGVAVPANDGRRLFSAQFGAVLAKSGRDSGLSTSRPCPPSIRVLSNDTPRRRADTRKAIALPSMPIERPKPI